MDNDTKILSDKTQKLLNELKWKRVAPTMLPQATQILKELQHYNNILETALTPEILESSKEEILVYLQWFVKQEQEFPDAPWLIQDGALAMIGKVHNRYNELLYKFAKTMYGNSIVGFIDRQAANYDVIKEAFKQEQDFDDEEVRDLRKALYVGK